MFYFSQGTTLSKWILTMVHVLRLNGDQTNRVLHNNRLSLRFLLNIFKVRKKNARRWVSELQCTWSFCIIVLVIGHKLCMKSIYFSTCTYLCVFQCSLTSFRDCSCIPPRVTRALIKRLKPRLCVWKEPQRN